jgi:hypothetical protein
LKHVNVSIDFAKTSTNQKMVARSASTVNAMDAFSPRRCGRRCQMQRPQEVNPAILELLAPHPISDCATAFVPVSLGNLPS